MNIKRVATFVGTYLTTAVVGLILFMLFMSRLPEEFSGNSMTNFLFSAMTIFCLVIAFPASAAYFVTFRYFKGDFVSGSKKAIWSIGLVATCVLLIFSAWKVLFKVRWAPYSLQSVSEEELADPSEKANGVVLEKGEGDVVYQLRRAGYKSEVLQLVKYLPRGDRVETLVAPDLFRSEGGNGVKDFWYDEKRGNLWTIEVNSLTSYLFAYMQKSLKGNYFSKGIVHEKKLIDTVASGNYSGSTILGFLDSTSELLLETGSGDGCGGGGTVWAVNLSGVKRDVQKYLSGCANDGKLPDLLGFSKGKLILASFKLSKLKENSSWEQNFHLLRLYYLDPENGAEETMGMDKDWPDVGYAYIEDKNKNIVKLTTNTGPDSKTYSFDLTAKKIVE